MHKIFIISFLMCLLSFHFNLSAQSNKPTEQSNPNIDFNKFISGVRVGILQFSNELQNMLDEGKNAVLADAMVEYCKSIGIEYVTYKSKEKDLLFSKLASGCDAVFISFSHETTNDYIRNISIVFTSCNGDNFVFKSRKNISLDDGYDWVVNEKKEWQSMYSRENTYYNVSNRLKLPTQNSEWTEAKLKNYFNINAADNIEGIWEKIRLGSEEVINAKYRLAVVKNKDDSYDIIYLDGANNPADWVEGEMKGTIVKTANKSLYSVNWLMAYKQKNKDVYCTPEGNGILTFTFSGNSQNKTIEDKFLKIYPIEKDNDNVNKAKSSATAFALTTDGCVLTSFHVIKSMKSCTLLFQKDNTIISYKLSKVGEDPNNDLAILKISDPSFKGFNLIPFTIKEKQMDVGDDVYVLGFPLTTTMGNELKLTNGIISSRSGFQGDLTSYQISAAVQPGNSGGPVFDKNGNLIGVISAKYQGAENVSYAVKSTLLGNLLESLNLNINKPKNNSLKGKSLSEQVKILRNYVFMIEVE